MEHSKAIIYFTGFDTKSGILTGGDTLSAYYCLTEIDASMLVMVLNFYNPDVNFEVVERIFRMMGGRQHKYFIVKK
jgi:hypothetical protein